MKLEADLMARLLNQEALIDPSSTTDLHHLEVVIAWNLDMPYRYAQEYFWLEVFAENDRRAVDIAQKWALEAGEAFESTDLVRDCAEHLLSTGELSISWGLPLPDDTPIYAPVRHPDSGLRIGFRAGEKNRRIYLPDALEQGLELVVAKPTKQGLPVCVVPLVRRATHTGPSLQ